MNHVRNGELCRYIADTKSAFIQPAYYEAFGLTVVEAMTCGLPTFAACHGGPAEIIAKEKSGFYIVLYDGDKAADLLVNFFDKCKADPFHWDVISLGGLKRIEEKSVSSKFVMWLCFRLDLLSLIVFTCSSIFLVSLPVGLINPGIAGLAVTYGLDLSVVQGSAIWNLCIMENKIISVERILQYTCIKIGPPLVIEENRPDSSWRSCGKISIQDFKVRYAPHLPLVLQSITCTFEGGKKTGLVGRTGSGFNKGKSKNIAIIYRSIKHHH